MKTDRPVHWLDVARGQITVLTERSRDVTAGEECRAVLQESVEELHVTLEELQVTNEELVERQQELSRAQAIIEAERRRYRRLFDLAPESYLVTDLAAVIQEANRAASHLLRVPERYLIGKPFLAFVSPRSRSEVREWLLQQASRGRDQRVAAWEIELRPRRAAPIVVSASVGVVADEPGQATTLHWLVRDVSALKRAEAEIRALNAELEQRVLRRTIELERANRQKDELLASERAARAEAEAARQRFAFLASASDRLSSSLDYRATLDNVARLGVPEIGDWCVVYLEDGGATRRAAVAHVDPTREAILRELDDRSPIDYATGRSALSALLTGEPVLLPVVTTESLRRRGAAPEQVAIATDLGLTSYLAVPLVIRGAVVGQLAFGRGLSRSAFSALDLELAVAYARRAAVAIDNARLLRRTEEAIRATEAFVASLSHDIKGPLTHIKGYAQLLRLRLGRPVPPANSEILTALAKIEGSATKIVAMIDELLARVELGRPVELDRRPIDLVAMVREVVAEFQETAGERVIRLDLLTPALIGCWDAARLERVLSNLISNALKYSPGGGEVIVQVAETGQADQRTAVLRVKDAGIGIPREDLAHLFERFHRGSNVVGRIDGQGLGLASCRQIVEQHGGTIAVESQEGQGSVFTIRLPVERGPAPE